MTETKSLIWDETFPSLLLKGEGCATFLHGQTTADIYTQKQLESIFLSCCLSTKGSLKALLEIRISNDMAEIVIIAGEINSIINGFESVIFPADKVNLEVLDPIRRIQKINNYQSWKKSTPLWISNNDLIENEIYDYTRATKEELEIWKIRQGIPGLDKEINGETNPYELGLGDIINLDKGCYLGQEAIARFFRSKSLKHQLRYWEAYGDADDFDIGKKILKTNHKNELNQKVGFITSSIKTNDNFLCGLALIKNNFINKDIYFSEKEESMTIKKPISFTQPF
ncbi:folate-binding protein YgfZ [Prochlorococcus marinus]|uniref:Folate-binding protein YgfZ n=1 Tax=Prochlorococcus marinus XMU1408 TaxID=2213228 RepID=A0A318QZ96_PROMR|nr:folate-binding protein YgfZ [Prochlorococcus marinus]MBW3041334.1 folate-binding protein YgfZ [Prochlorococcus marinus str. XMU1408]PYE02506.1 folate-binding protein YgfZ [Prochlorococcus marinus XMU1408]